MLDRVTGFEHEIGIKFLVKHALVSSQGVAYVLSLMLILKYFAIVGAVLFAALWALAVHFEPYNSDAPAVLHSTTARFLPAPAPEAESAIEPESAQPAAAAASAPPSTHAAHHRTPVH
jgi:hypothetical protein